MFRHSYLSEKYGNLNFKEMIKDAIEMGLIKNIKNSFF
jgi:hypothetical protein